MAWLDTEGRVEFEGAEGPTAASPGSLSSKRSTVRQFLMDPWITKVVCYAYGISIHDLIRYQGDLKHFPMQADATQVCSMMASLTHV